MSTRGAKLIEKARRERDQRAAAFNKGRSANKPRTPGAVVLQPPMDSLDLSEVPPWEDVAARQGLVTDDSLSNALVGEVVALYDRNLMSEPWRQVYAVRDEDDFFVLYSKTGLIIDEETTPKGRQAVTDLVSEFAQDGFYYKPPTPRPTPEARRLVHEGRRSGGRESGVRESGVRENVSQQIEEEAFERDRLSESESGDDDVSEKQLSRPSSPAAEIDASGEASTAPQQDVQVDDPVDNASEGEEEGAAADGTQESGGEHNEGARQDEAQPDRPILVGSRVRIERADGDSRSSVHGLVASRGFATILVATDLGEWETHPLSTVGTRIVADETEPANSTGVVGLAYGHTNKTVTGMLMGRADETALGGKVGAYCAHIAKTEDPPAGSGPNPRNGVGLDPNKRAANHTFRLGDVLQQLAKPCEPSESVFAAVVRVLYSRRAQQQSRRLLILVELDSQKKFTATPDCPPVFFPASWLHWSRLESELSVPIEDIQRIETVSAPRACIRAFTQLVSHGCVACERNTKSRRRRT